MQPLVYPSDMGGAWGITRPLPRQAWQRGYWEFSDQIVDQLGACLEAARQASLADLAEAASSWRRLQAQLGRLPLLSNIGA